MLAKLDVKVINVMGSIDEDAFVTLHLQTDGSISFAIGNGDLTQIIELSDSAIDAIIEMRNLRNAAESNPPEDY